MERRYDLVVIGGGVAGYPVAVLAAKAGLNVLLVEERLLGGECTNYGCVPSKALLHYAGVAAEAARLGMSPSPSRSNAFAYASRVAGEERSGIEALLRAAGVEVARGRGLVEGCGGEACRVLVGDACVEAGRVVVATGSEPLWPGWAEKCDRVVDNRGLFERGLPEDAENVLVVGGGVAGVEVAQAMARLGASVTLVEAMERILPGLPAQASRIATRMLRRDGVEVVTGSPVQRITCRNGAPRACIRGECRDYDFVVLMLGRRPRRDAVLRVAGGEPRLDERNRVIGAERLYVVGDAAGPPLLAHKAIADALTAAADILGWGWWRRPRVYPTVVYTDPEIVVVDACSGEASVVRHYWGYAAPARIHGLPAQLVYAELGVREGRVCRVVLVGPGVSEAAGEASLIVERGLRLEEVAGVSHPHPSSNEALFEAVLAALGALYNRA